MYLDSAHSKKTLSSHRNIKVLRHPEHHATAGVYFWSNHEKMIVVDQAVAFVGGVDLCLGRWEDDAHRYLDYSCLFLI